MCYATPLGNLHFFLKHVFLNLGSRDNQGGKAHLFDFSPAAADPEGKLEYLLLCVVLVSLDCWKATEADELRGRVSNVGYTWYTMRHPHCA